MHIDITHWYYVLAVFASLATIVMTIERMSHVRQWLRRKLEVLHETQKIINQRDKLMVDLKAAQTIANASEKAAEQWRLLAEAINPRISALEAERNMMRQQIEKNSHDIHVMGDELFTIRARFRAAIEYIQRLSRHVLILRTIIAREAPAAEIPAAPQPDPILGDILNDPPPTK